jgi:hypothetical protein
MRKNIFTTMILSIGLPVLFFGQSDNVNKILPPSPEVYQFSKYIDMPSSNFTGNPDIGIPIYNINIDGFNIPITLNYVGTSGIRVDENASRFGLGWILDIGGGSITKDVVGRPDTVVRPRIKTNPNDYEDIYDFECPAQDTENKAIFKSLTASDGSDQFVLPATVYYPGLDLQPDVYNYQIIGEKGSFVYDYLHNIQLIPKSNSKITPLNATSDIGFNIIDENGIEYHFISTNFSNFFNGTYEVPITTMFKPDYVRFPSGKEIRYKYDKGVGLKTFSFSSSSYLEGSFTTSSACSVKFMGGGKNNVYSENLISEIIFDKGVITFEYENRSDIVNDVYLKSVKVFDKNEHIVKNINFSTDYFYSTEETPISPGPLGENPSRRLKLNFIEDEVTHEKYSFQYYKEDAIPNRYSFGIDHWGMSNGKNFNDTRINAVVGKLNLNVNPTTNNFYRFSNREPDEEFGNAGMLKKIIYPAKGYMELIYEPDDYYYNKDYTKYSEPFNLDNSPSDYNSPLEVDTSENFEKTIILNTKPNAFDFRGKFYSTHNENYGGAGGWGEDGMCTVSIAEASGSGIPINLISNSANMTFDLKPSTSYNIHIKNIKNDGSGNNPNANRCFFDINYRTYQTNLVKNKKVGTFRIKEILKYDSDQTPLLKKKYTYKLNDSSRSSGVMMDPPITYLSNTKSFKKVLGFYGAVVGVDECNQLTYSGSSKDEINTNFGKPIGYTKVIEESIDIKNPSNSIKKEYYYDLGIDENDTANIGFKSFVPMSPRKYRRGLLEKEIGYKNNNPVYTKSFKYEYDYHFNFLSKDKEGYVMWGDEAISYGLVPFRDGVLFCPGGSMVGDSYSIIYDYYIYPIYSVWTKPVEEKITTYYNQDSLSTTTKTYFSSSYLHIKPLVKEIESPNHDFEEKFYKYAFEKGNTYLQSKNIISIPLETEVKNNGKTISKTETLYPDSEQQAKERILNNTENKDFPLPRNVLSYNLDNLNISDLEINYDFYDTKGNLLQYTTKNGISTAIIWDKSQTQPIAKVEGASYAQASAVAGDIVTASDQSQAGYTEANLLAKLDAFRTASTLAGFQITTYTYKPLIGVSSITPPSGVREVYTYDTANRLQSVVDVDGKILKEYSYKYKQ